MRMRWLGKTGLQVSELCLGTATFGGRGKFKFSGELDQKGANQIVDMAFDAGINFFNTAEVYSDGLAEEIFGKAIGGRRKDAIVITKVNQRASIGKNDGGLSRKHIMEACEASLQRIGTDYIDIYELHGVDPNTVVMGLSELEPCDVDLDGDCDVEDCWLVNSALDKCSKQSGYHPLADFNGDGCVTTSDIDFMLGPREPDLTGDGIVNLLDLGVLAAHWSPGVQGDWCRAADFDTSCVVDLLDLTVLAGHWLDESP